MPAPRFRRVAWLLPAILAVHVAEEAPGFAAWARRNAWRGYRDRDFVAINAAGVALTAGATLVATRTTSRAAFAAYHVAMLSAQALWNPVFHAATTLAYREYSPGVVTAVALFPATWVLLTTAAIGDGRLTRRGAVLSAALGAPLHAAAVAQQVYGIGARR
jgi:Protein of unknown function with HXXEE motif